MDNKRVLMVATVPSVIGQFNMNNIKILQEMGYTVDVAVDFTDTSVWPTERVQRFKEQLNELGIEAIQLDFSRSPLKLNRHIASYKETLKLLKERNYSFIHTHTPVASAIVRLAARKTESKVIYTAHGFHFYDGAPLKNWIAFYPIEKWLSKYTDVLITINKEDYKRASKKFKAKKTIYVPGVGVDTKKFAPRISSREKIRKELNISDNRVLLLSVGELNENKNQESVIRAITGIENITYVIVGKGELKERLESVASECGVDLRLVGFRMDIADFYDAADIYILPSIREGLNVSLMEAMASSLPCLCGNIRGNVDLIDEHGGYLFDPENLSEIREAIEKVLDNRKGMGEYNLHKIRAFDLSVVNDLTLEIYRGGGNRHLSGLINRQNKRRELDIPIDAFLLMSVGELNDNKNHSVVIKAIGHIKKNNVYYVIAGKGPLYETLEKLAEKYKIKNQVRLLGFRTDIPDLYNTADVCVFPSIREGQGIAAIEGMASGLPLIVSDNRGTRGFLSDENAITCSYNDVEAFASGIKTLMKNANKRYLLGNSNLKKSKDFDKTVVTKRMLEIYSSM